MLKLRIETVQHGYDFTRKVLITNILFGFIIYFILENITTNKVPILQERKNVSGKQRFVCRFSTLSFTNLTWLHELFYINSIKVIPVCIGEYNPLLALAI